MPGWHKLNVKNRSTALMRERGREGEKMNEWYWARFWGMHIRTSLVKPLPAKAHTWGVERGALIWVLTKCL